MDQDNFEIGQVVLARFTNCHHVHEFVGEIVGKTKNYWKIKAVTSPYASQGEAPGRVFQIATLASRIYSVNNSIQRVVVR